MKKHHVGCGQDIRCCTQALQDAGRPCVYPLHVGKGACSPGWLRDDAGEHISGKNPLYCELTGLYWAWKNSDADAVGFVHYRRHFLPGGAGVMDTLRDVAGLGPGGHVWERILTGAEAQSLMERQRVVVPVARNYVIERVGSHFSHAHGAAMLGCLRKAMMRVHPDAMSALEHLLAGRRVHLFNMFLMRADMFNAYCAWLFDLLFELESLLAGAGILRPRMVGFAAERLLDVWLAANSVPFAEAPVIFMERRNWLKKAGAFVWRTVKGLRPMASVAEGR